MTKVHPRLMNLLLLAVAALVAVAGSLHASDPNNPTPCTEWVCTETASVTSVTVEGPKELKVGEEKTWTATAVTSLGKQICTGSGASRDCPVTQVKWSMTAGDKSSNTNSITRSWTTAGTYTVSATGDPVADCCPGSGTSGSLQVVVKCKASAAQQTDKWAFPPFAEFLKEKLEQIPDKIPYVTKAEVGMGVDVTRTIGEECCPGASYPTPYKSISVNLTASANFKVYIPGLSVVGGTWLSARSPGWFGDPYYLFSARIQWAAGVFGALAGEVKVLGDNFKYESECGPCFSAEVSGTLGGSAGIGGTASCKVWIGQVIDGAPDYEMATEILGAANISASVKGKIEIGAQCEGFKGQVCYDGLTLTGVISFEITGFGSFEKTLTSDPIGGACKEF